MWAGEAAPGDWKAREEWAGVVWAVGRAMSGWRDGAGHGRGHPHPGSSMDQAVRTAAAHLGRPLPGRLSQPGQLPLQHNPGPPVPPGAAVCLVGQRTGAWSAACHPRTGALLPVGSGWWDAWWVLLSGLVPKASRSQPVTPPTAKPASGRVGVTWAAGREFQPRTP